MLSFAYVRKQLQVALTAPRRSVQLDALQRLADGLDHLEHQAKEAQACIDAMNGGLLDEDDTAIDPLMDPMPTIAFNLPF